MSSTILNPKERPIIGVVTQTATLEHPNGKTQIAASYVKFLEIAGARVLPVKLHQTHEEYTTLFNSINGYNNNELVQRFFKLLTINKDKDGDVVSTMEAREFPFYSTVWHPEKPMFEWIKSCVPQCISAVKVTHYMAHFFVREARKSSHRFKDKEEERAALIYNYNPVYTGDATVFEQMYFL
ncbi:gamma-glutamyl hydrolase-like [Aplochiton taeniatus]